MKKRHLKFIPIVLAAPLFTLTSCVDNDYDLDDNIDLTIQVGGSEFAIPGGETEPIPLSKILDIEEDGVVKTTPSGDYYLLQEGSEKTTNIFVNGFKVNSPNINPIDQEISFTIPEQLSSIPPQEISAELPEKKTEFDIKGENLPSDIKNLSVIKMDMEAKIHFSFTPAVASKLSLKGVVLNFPEFIISSKLTNGMLKLKDQEVHTATSTSGLTLIVPIEGIDCNKNGVVFDETSHTLSIHGDIVLNGEVSINTGDVDQRYEGTTTSVTLLAEINLEDANTKESIVNVNSVTGIVKPDIDITLDPVTLTGLPDFLSDEKVTLSVENPMVFFTADNKTPVAAGINGNITSYIYNDNGEKIPLLKPEDPTVLFNFTVAKEKKQEFCLSPIAPTGMEDVIHVEVSNMPSLITKIPDLFEFDVITEATDEETEIELNKTYTITTDYNVNVPFVFGPKITTIVYKDSVDGWYDDLKDYEVKQINATATAINKIPLGLNFTAEALTVDDQGKSKILDGVVVTVIVDGEKDGIIKAGNNNTATESSLVIEIVEKTPGAVKMLDGLAFEVVAASTTGAEGQQLNENQTLQLKNVRLKVPGGVIVDLN